ncbi:hypothetical protein [Xylella fastidiosa]|uniref:hypothetical protein n=1 Tax=Xylella fastidiosa TaxID=2371 RepID=UPI001E33AC32|nr:hypothetical protein [Xylella fastidiosa]
MSPVGGAFRRRRTTDVRRAARQQLAVAFNGGRQYVQGFHHGAHGVGRHPGVERCELGFQHVTEEGAGFAAALGVRILRRD